MRGVAMHLPFDQPCLPPMYSTAEADVNAEEARLSSLDSRQRRHRVGNDENALNSPASLASSFTRYLSSTSIGLIFLLLLFGMLVCPCLTTVPVQMLTYCCPFSLAHSTILVVFPSRILSA